MSADKSTPSAKPVPEDADKPSAADPKSDAKSTGRVQFDSRGNAEYASKVLSAMRLGFGGHVEGKS